jgi:hypothetical protein
MGKNRHRHTKPRNTSLSKSVRNFLMEKEFQIHGTHSCENCNQLLETIEALSNPKKEDQKIDVYSDLLKLLAEISTGLWRTQQRMVDPATNEPQNEMRRAYRPLLSTLDALSRAGVEIKDRTNEKYVVGLSEKVIAVEPTPGLQIERIIETVKPSVYYQGNCLQLGEIIVGVPAGEDQKQSN